jgi:hypothetical protein
MKVCMRPHTCCRRVISLQGCNAARSALTLPPDLLTDILKLVLLTWRERGRSRRHHVPHPWDNDGDYFGSVWVLDFRPGRPGVLDPLRTGRATVRLAVADAPTRATGWVCFSPFAPQRPQFPSQPPSHSYCSMFFFSFHASWSFDSPVIDSHGSFFMDMKSTIEIATEKRRRRMQRRMFAMDSGKSLDPEGNGVVILAHSLGNLVLRYFFDWLLNEVGMNHFHTWVDKHIYMYVTRSNYSRVARVTFRVYVGRSFLSPLRLHQSIHLSW